MVSLKIDLISIGNKQSVRYVSILVVQHWFFDNNVTPAFKTEVAGVILTRSKQMYFVGKKFFFPTKLKPRFTSFQFWRYRCLKLGIFKKIKMSVFESTCQRVKRGTLLILQLFLSEAKYAYLIQTLYSKAFHDNFSKVPCYVYL